MALFAHYAHRRRATFAAIRQAGGDVQMGIGKPALLEKWYGAELFGTLMTVDLREGRADNALLAHIAVLKELSELDLSDDDIDDEGLRLIVHLPLRELWARRALSGSPSISLRHCVLMPAVVGFIRRPACGIKLVIASMVLCAFSSAITILAVLEAIRRYDLMP